MNIDPADYLRCREIGFAELHPEPDQSGMAGLLLVEVHGVKQVNRLDEVRIEVIYDLTRITLKVIEQALLELGFHLDNSLLANMKRALIYYAEETMLQNLDAEPLNAQGIREIFVNRYRQLSHGCRDTRKGHWRKYS